MSELPFSLITKESVINSIPIPRGPNSDSVILRHEPDPGIRDEHGTPDVTPLPWPDHHRDCPSNVTNKHIKPDKRCFPVILKASLTHILCLTWHVQAAHLWSHGDLWRPWQLTERVSIKVDLLIWISESSLLGWFSEVSLIRDNQGRETVWLSRAW